MIGMNGCLTSKKIWIFLKGVIETSKKEKVQKAHNFWLFKWYSKNEISKKKLTVMEGWNGEGRNLFFCDILKQKIFFLISFIIIYLFIFEGNEMGARISLPEGKKGNLKQKIIIKENFDI